MEGESLGYFYLPFVLLIQTQYLKNVERKTREREKKERKTSPRETWFLLNPIA